MCIKKQMRVSPTRIGIDQGIWTTKQAMRNATCHWENHRNPCANLVDFDCQFKLPEDDYKKRWTTTGFLSNGDVMCTQLFYGSRCCTEDNSCGFFVNASSSCILPKWFWPNSVTSWTLQSGRLENSAQRSLRQGFLKLVTVEGHVLTNPQNHCKIAGVQDGEHLTAVAQHARATATGAAFAVWCCGGNRIITWGNFMPSRDCDCCTVQDQLRNVQQMKATGDAFAAILADGSVVAWGDPYCGGDCSAVQDQLRNVQQIQAAADPGCRWGICCDLGWWIGGCLGQSILGWWLFCCSRWVSVFVEECPVHMLHIYSWHIVQLVRKWHFHSVQPTSRNWQLLQEGFAHLYGPHSPSFGFVSGWIYPVIVLLLGGLEHEWIMIFPSYWNTNHPKWLMFFGGVESWNYYTTNQIRI